VHHLSALDLEVVILQDPAFIPTIPKPGVIDNDALARSDLGRL
jgi:hypothetical protein